MNMVHFLQETWIFRSWVENSGLTWKIPVSCGKFRFQAENFQFQAENSKLCSSTIILEIPPQAGCGPAAQYPWPGILGNPFCSVEQQKKN
jgi:hypothetical protein